MTSIDVRFAINEAINEWAEANADADVRDHDDARVLARHIRDRLQRRYRFVDRADDEEDR